MSIGLQSPRLLDFSSDLDSPLCDDSHLDDDDPNYLGYRLVRQPDGDYLQVALTEEDWIHPKPGDKRVATLDHGSTIRYVNFAIEKQFDELGQGSVTADLLLNWKLLKLVPRIRNMQPDVAVFPQLPLNAVPRKASSYDVTPNGIPRLVFEVLSKQTAHLDRNRKLALYARIGVEQVVLLDVRSKVYQPRRPLVQGYVLTEQVHAHNGAAQPNGQVPQRRYVEQSADDHGRIPLVCLGWSVNVENETAFLYRENGERIPYVEDALKQEKERADQLANTLARAKAIFLDTAFATREEQTAAFEELFCQQQTTAKPEPLKPTSKKGRKKGN